MHSFPDPIQLETLITFSEECSECAVAASKIIRFGPDEDSRERLLNEIGDFLCMVDLLDRYGIIDLNEEVLNDRVNYKKEKLKKWSTYISEELIFSETYPEYEEI